MALSSVPGLFDGKNERIEDYKEGFDFYCVAHGVAEETQKALFLTSIGQQMYVKLKTCIRPRTFSELTLAQIVAKLKERTMEETIEIAERYKFFKRVQQPGETVIEYMSGLKQLASTCNFSEYLDTALRDQLVCGIRDQRIQRELLSLKDLTVTLTLQKSQAIEVATKETENLQHLSAVETGNSATHALTQVPLGNFSKCHRCGSGQHKAKNCPHKEKRCNQCKKLATWHAFAEVHQPVRLARATSKYTLINSRKRWKERRRMMMMITSLVFSGWKSFRI